MRRILHSLAHLQPDFIPCKSGVEAWTQRVPQSLLEGLHAHFPFAAQLPECMLSPFARRLSQGNTQRERIPASSAGEQQVHAALAPFLAQNAPTPPVRFVEGMPPPTALSWLRRRGPPTAHGALHRAFRKRQVRVFDGQRVKRVSSSRVLSPGEVLLYPRELLLQEEEEEKEEEERVWRDRTSFAHRDRLTPPTIPDRQSSVYQQQPMSRHSREEASERPWSPLSGPRTTRKVPRARIASFDAYGEPQPWSPPSGPQTTHEVPPAKVAAFDAHGEPQRQQARLSYQQPLSPPYQERQQQQQQQQQHFSYQLPQHQGDAAALMRGWDPDSDDPFIPKPAFGGKPLTPGLIRSCVLGYTRELVFINKPFGLMVQGFKNTLEAMMDPALKVHPKDDTPRLVHRLDRNVSGVMAVARSADAAAWLAACFRDKASQVTRQQSLMLRNRVDKSKSRSLLLLRPPSADSAAPSREVPEGMSVKRVYWAIVASDSLPRGREGRMHAPVLAEGRQLAALTYYRVRHVSEGLAWVELTPQTGRRHQLRNHCARVLKAPIVGDVRYGYKGVVPSKRLARVLPPSFWTTFSPRTAEAVLNPPSRKDRRRAAAAAARARAASNPSRLELVDEVEEDEESEGEALVSEGGSDEPEKAARGRAKQEGPVAGNAPSGSSKNAARDRASSSSSSSSISSSSRSSSSASQVGAGLGTAAAMEADAELPGVGETRANRMRRAEREVPLLLHARTMVVQRPGKSKTTRVTAPLPSYMAAIFAALNWPLPND
ncbi:hypothetical protein DUNSADRAFT_4397 [Dunaliella salina]|uniref:Pseudouridine synthase RsuA/RluA-like domain-containing protein n=1 Tax=Dunaliella salina TaxID=3046 RepID=A0ABQ7GS29_DUNSA|nr:hypothetical protein DUNSADRAFT_4397 [Dunaliella salina]|eukprot:KAF5837417.1 hypothetical protein DUNSADRAFT_4397 [Dunaliella salina]